MEHKITEKMIIKDVDGSRISGTEGRILGQDVEWNHVQA